MDVMMHRLNEQKRKGSRQRLEVIEVVITGERSREDETWMEGAEKGIFHIAKPMTAPRGGLGKEGGETS